MNLSDREELYHKHFFFGYFGKDFTDKVALVSLLNHIYNKIKEKKHDVTQLQILKSLTKDIPDESLQNIALISENLGYGCENFPTFNIPDKEIPNKIKEMLKKYIPF